MDTDSNALWREMRTFLEFVSRADSPRTLDARTHHVTAPYRTVDFNELSARLTDAGATGSVSILARDLDSQAEAVAALAADGHEIVLHGLRHTTFESVDYETAHAELSTALSQFEDVAGLTPSGFHVPFMDMSEGTVRAATELGLSWVLGRPEVAVPELTVVEPVEPWDFHLFENGEAPEDAFDRLDEPPAAGEVFLMHPNLHPFYGATDAFETWLKSRAPVSVDQAITSGDEALVLDCLAPIRVR
jgi:hypothetical protein